MVWAVLSTFHPICLPDDLTVCGVGLRSLACWDCGFECGLGHGCLSVVGVVCCHVVVSATSWSLVQRSPTECGASLCVILKSRKWARHGSRWAAAPQKKMPSSELLNEWGSESHSIFSGYQWCHPSICMVIIDNDRLWSLWGTVWAWSSSCSSAYNARESN